MTIDGSVVNEESSWLLTAAILTGPAALAALWRPRQALLGGVAAAVQCAGLSWAVRELPGDPLLSPSVLFAALAAYGLAWTAGAAMPFLAGGLVRRGRTRMRSGLAALTLGLAGSATAAALLEAQWGLGLWPIAFSSASAAALATLGRPETPSPSLWSRLNGRPDA